jgi:hypothetical protein
MVLPLCCAALCHLLYGLDLVYAFEVNQKRVLWSDDSTALVHT